APTPTTFARVAGKVERLGGGRMVGEWSAALNPGSRRGEEREVAEFVRARLVLYERWCSGWYWWTYKKKKGWRDTGWSFRDAVEGGVFPSWVGMKRPAGYSRDLDKESTARKSAA